MTKDPNLEKSRQEAMEVAEAARETEWKHPSFVAELFMGRFRPDLIFPFPEQDPADKKEGDEYMARVEAFLRENLDADAADENKEIPASVIKGLFELGAFGMKIPKEYGGLGLSQTNYNRVVSMVASYCGSTAVWLSAHQSIGVPTPLKAFGTKEQKEKFLPRLAKDAVSAFALTEPDVGSDPAKMQTTATPTEDGKHYILNGQKLWCTNGPDSDILIVMARTPSIMKNGKERKQITAFIVDRKESPFEVVHRCDFMGLKAISNGLLEFKDCKVPTENILGGPGKGLKIALTTLNTGRLTLPGACGGMSKQALLIARRFANERVQWGNAVGKHEAVATKLAFIAAHTFAMEAETYYTTELVGRGGADIRLEAAMAKMFASEKGWDIIDEAVQVRGGRGYETAPSLAGRGEPGHPIERMMRDARINTIIEGTSQIMRLFLAREALDPHMRKAAPLLNPKSTFGEKFATFVKCGVFYAGWYPMLWLKSIPLPGSGAGPLSKHLGFVRRNSAKLARSIFHAMIGNGPKLERRQILLGRIIDIGSDLFAMSAACSRAWSMYQSNPQDKTPIHLADYFCEEARLRIKASFRSLRGNNDRQGYKVAREVLDGKLAWVEDGIMPSTGGSPAQKVKPSVSAENPSPEKV